MIFRFLLISLLSLTNIQCANKVTGYDAIVDQQLRFSHTIVSSLKATCGNI